MAAAQDESEAGMGDIGIGFYVLGSLYVLLALIAMLRLAQLSALSQDSTRQLRVSFHVLLFFWTTTRAAWLLLEPPRFSEFSDSWREYWNSTVGTLPFFLATSTYTLLLCFWAELYYSVFPNPEKMPLLRKRYWQGNAVMYGTVAVFYLLLVFEDEIPRDLLRSIFYSLIGVTCASYSCAFCYIGLKLFNTFREATHYAPLINRQSTGVDMSRYRRLIRTVGFVTVFTFFTMLGRSAVIFFKAFQDVSDEVNLIYYILTDFLPCVVIFVLMRRVPPMQTGRNSFLYRACCCLGAPPSEGSSGSRTSINSRAAEKRPPPLPDVPVQAAV